MGASTHAAVHCHPPPGGCALPLIPLFRAGAVGGAAGATQLASRPYIAHIGLTLAGLGAEEESKKKKEGRPRSRRRVGRVDAMQDQASEATLGTADS